MFPQPGLSAVNWLQLPTEPVPAGEGETSALGGKSLWMGLVLVPVECGQWEGAARGACKMWIFPSWILPGSFPPSWSFFPLKQPWEHNFSPAGVHWQHQSISCGCLSTEWVKNQHFWGVSFSNHQVCVISVTCSSPAVCGAQGEASPCLTGLRFPFLKAKRPGTVPWLWEPRSGWGQAQGVTLESLGLWQCQLCSCSLNSISGIPCGCVCPCCFLNSSLFLRETIGESWIQTANNRRLQNNPVCCCEGRINSSNPATAAQVKG